MPAPRRVTAPPPGSAGPSPRRAVPGLQPVTRLFLPVPPHLPGGGRAQEGAGGSGEAVRAGRRGGAERSGEAADAQDGRCCSGGGGGATGGGGGAPEPVGAGGAGRCGHPRVPQLRGPVAAAGGARPVW